MKVHILYEICKEYNMLSFEYDISHDILGIYESLDDANAELAILRARAVYIEYTLESHDLIRGK